MATSAAYIDLDEGAAPATPGAAQARLYVKADGLLYWKDDAGNEYAVGTSSTSVATDSIWDAAGDLVQGTGANTAARLAIGAAASVLESTGSAAAWEPFAGASYATNAGQSIVTGAAVAIVDFEDQIYDPGSDVTTGASWAYTAPKTGIYLVTAMVQFANSSGWADQERGLMQLFKNGSVYRNLDRKDSYTAASSVIMVLHGATTVSLTAAETIDVRVAQNSGGNLALSASTAENWIDIVRIR